MKTAIRIVVLGLISLAPAPAARSQPSLPPPLDREKASEEVYSRMRTLYSIIPLERGRAALALGDAGSEALPAVPYLKSMLDDDALLTMRSTTGGAVSTSPGKEAARALVRILSPEEAFAVLRGAADAGPAAIRAAAARGLAEIGDSASYRILERLVRNDPAPPVRASALSALDRIDTPETADLLVGALEDPDSDVRKTAAYIVTGKQRSWLVEPLVRALGFPGDFARKTALEALGSLPDAETRPELAAMIEDEDRSIRLAALAILGRNADFPPGPVLNRLADPDWRVREAAFALLAPRSDREIAARFLDLLRDRENTGRRYAILWLGRHRVDAAAAVATCLNDPDAEIRKLAVAYLGEQEGTDFLSRIAAGARDRDWAVRQAVAEALARHRGPTAIPVLLELLSDGDWRVRETAATSLQNYPEPETAQALIRLLDDDDPRTVVLAVRILGGLGETKALAEIARRAFDSNRSIREEAASSLGKLGGTGAVDTLIRLLGDESSRVRATAAAALGRCGDRRAALALLRLALESNQEVRTSALEALLSLDPEWTGEEHREAADLIYTALASTDFRISDYALGQAGKLGDPPLVERLLIMLETGDWRRRGKIVDALGKAKDARALPSLIKLLGVRDPLLGATVPEAILGLESPETAALLLKALPEAGENKKIAIIQLLGEIRDPGSVEGLLDALRDPQAPVRARAAAALAELPDPRSIPPLLKALQDDSAPVRAAAAAALGKRKDCWIADSLCRLGDDPSVEVRRTAVDALGKMGCPDAVPALTKALDDPDREVREKAVAALRTLDTPGAVRSLVEATAERNDSTGDLAGEALGEAGAIAPLLEGLRSSDPETRKITAQRLGELRATEASNMLIMSLDDRESAVRVAAAGALGKIGGEGVIEPLIDALEDLEPAVRAAAAQSLQVLTGKDFGYDANEWRRYWKRAH